MPDAYSDFPHDVSPAQLEKLAREEQPPEYILGPQEAPGVELIVRDTGFAQNFHHNGYSNQRTSSASPIGTSPGRNT